MFLQSVSGSSSFPTTIELVGIRSVKVRLACHGAFGVRTGGLEVCGERQDVLVPWWVDLLHFPSPASRLSSTYSKFSLGMLGVRWLRVPKRVIYRKWLSGTSTNPSCPHTCSGYMVTSQLIMVVLTEDSTERSEWECTVSGRAFIELRLLYTVPYANIECILYLPMAQSPRETNLRLLEMDSGQIQYGRWRRHAKNVYQQWNILNRNRKRSKAYSIIRRGQYKL